MSVNENQYLSLLDDIKRNGTFKEDRTGTGTYSVFGRQLRFDLSRGDFPLLTTKKMNIRHIVAELLWFLKGLTHTQYLHDNNVHIWDEWADENGDLGPIYGEQWRDWTALKWSEKGTVLESHIDQIRWVINEIQRNPDSRRLIVSAWNVGDLDRMALQPCHCMFQFYVADGKLSCQMYQRSADVFLGVPYNIASYSLLTMMVAQVTGYEPGDFVHTFGDVHIYSNHMEQVNEQLSRMPMPAPSLTINQGVMDIDGFEIEDFELWDYDPYPAIKAPVAV